MRYISLNACPLAQDQLLLLNCVRRTWLWFPLLHKACSTWTSITCSKWLLANTAIPTTASDKPTFNSGSSVYFLDPASVSSLLCQHCDHHHSLPREGQSSNIQPKEHLSQLPWTFSSLFPILYFQFMHTCFSNFLKLVHTSRFEENISLCFSPVFKTLYVFIFQNILFSPPFSARGSQSIFLLPLRLIFWDRVSDESGVYWLG